MRPILRTTTVSLWMILSAAASDALACTCMLSPTNCQMAADAAAVFEATVASMQLVEETSPDVSGVPLATHLNVVTLRDLRALRGDAQSTVVTALHSASCGFDFKVGTRYLIVASRVKDGRLAVSRCGLTRAIAAASGLQEYVAMLSGATTRTRVWGQVNMATRWNDFEREYAPVPGSRVTIAGPERRTVVTGADGRYVFADLPHGDYTLTAEAPASMPLGEMKPMTFSLAASQTHACAETGFNAPIRSSISGVITDAAGQPRQGVFVEIGLPDQADLTTGEAGGGTTTDAHGRYEFRDLPPGRYVVGLNIWGSGSPYFSARGLTPAGQSIISLTLGENLTLRPIVAFPR